MRRHWVAAALIWVGCSEPAIATNTGDALRSSVEHLRIEMGDEAHAQSEQNGPTAAGTLTELSQIRLGDLYADRLQWQQLVDVTAQEIVAIEEELDAAEELDCELTAVSSIKARLAPLYEALEERRAGLRNVNDAIERLEFERAPRRGSVRRDSD